MRNIIMTLAYVLFMCACGWGLEYTLNKPIPGVYVALVCFALLFIGLYVSVKFAKLMFKQIKKHIK